MKTPVLLVLLLVAASTTSGFAGNIRTELDGKLIALHGNSTEPYKGPEVAHSKYVVLYFSAGWCGPCHLFTPQLSEFYKALKAKFPDFEIVFISRDYTEAAMEKYMVETSMPWPAVRYAVAKTNEALNNLCGPGIPDLVLLNENGQVISDSFVNGAYVGPVKVLKDLTMLLDGTGQVVADDPASPTPGKAEN
jgi:thiol-disulfide isomerase/thioredoxin